jgi:hypothetical protein
VEATRVPVRGPLCAGDVVLLLDEVERHWAAGREVLCDVEGVCDLGVIDALSRLALLARRHAAWLRVQAATDDAQRLLELTGLAGALRVQVRRPSPPPQC